MPQYHLVDPRKGRGDSYKEPKGYFLVNAPLFHLLFSSSVIKFPQNVVVSLSLSLSVALNLAAHLFYIVLYTIDTIYYIRITFRSFLRVRFA